MGRSVKRKSDEYGYNSAFPKILRALMENKDDLSPLKRSVTQAELARYLGITRQAVSAYTLGESIPDMLTFKAIADYFQVSYAYLLGVTNVLKDENKNLAETAGLRPQTQNAILNICKSGKHAFAFMCLVETMEFYDIINAIASYLDICWTRSYSTQELLAFDEEIRKKTGGALHVVPAKLEKNMLIQSAQTYLADAIKFIDQKTDPTAKANDGRIWREEEK